MKGTEEALFGSARPTRSARRLALAVAALLSLTFPAAAAAAPPEPEPYQAHDFGGFRNILPPAQGANVNGAGIAAFEANGTYPPHSSDAQLDMYSNLVFATPGLKKSEIPDYYKDASFGIAPGKQEGDPYSPRGDVTIVRDEFGVPHIYGSTRAGAMFGAGYVAAEDRLFMIDVLRHAGRAQLSSFIGGASANREMDQSVWADTPYAPDDSELQEQYDRADELYGQLGVQIQDDVTNYVAGVNQFIDEACANPVTKLPGEYSLIQLSQSICLPGHEWKVTDVISTASLVAGIFGKGGGNELNSALALEAARQQFGNRRGKKVWADFREANDPERPLTVRHGRFPYEQVPKDVRGLALPDPGSVQFSDVVQSSTAASSSASTTSQSRLPDVGAALKGLSEQNGASNALLVSARESKGGHPAAVMGPQVAYWSPEILMEEDIHAPPGDGPPIDARGTAFPGTNLYVQLGRGRDYAWSATSAGQDIIDTFAVKLCDPNGGQATIDSTGYRFEGQCLPFDVLTRENSWTPSPADMTAAGSETLQSLRSALGIVIARATIDGKPYAYTKLRDTYFHEVDPSAAGFADYNNPRKMESPQEFMRAACKISFTFNWFYVDDEHIAYFNSGQNPIRAPHVDPNFPTLGKKRFLWRGYDPDAATEDQMPCSEHPQVVDQRFITSWNNAQAHGYRAADDNYAFGTIHRSQSLDQQIRPRIRGDKRISLQKLIDAMEVAGSVDLRGTQVLPWLLKVIDAKPVTDPDLEQAIQTLRAWHASGAHRVDLDKDGTYDDTDAVRIMDAWWPRLVEAEFKPVLGDDAFEAIRKMMGLDDAPGQVGPDGAPSRVGSAYISGWYGYVQKDLRDLLGKPVRGGYSRVYCGGGKLGKCRQALLDSLADALANDGDGALYGGPCELGTDEHSADPQQCQDAIEFRAIGAITQPLIPWINRPTFQQAVQVQGHR